MPWSQTIEVALILKELLDQLGLASFPKTSGGKGFHVLVPLDRRSTLRGHARASPSIVAGAIARTHPKLATTEWSKARRRGVLIDSNQNGEGKTIASVVLGAAEAGRAGVDAARLGRGERQAEPVDLHDAVVLERVRTHGDLLRAAC